MNENPYEAPRLESAPGSTARRRSLFMAMLFLVLGILGVTFIATLLIVAAIQGSDDADLGIKMLIVAAMGSIWIVGSFWMARRMFVRVDIDA